jgi:hypothetical protein
MTVEAPKELRDGRYVLMAPLGQGSQGTTWDAVDKREGREVAIKAFDVRGAKAWKDVELAEREARVLAELSHPALPRYIEHFEDDGTLYLVMEKVQGKPLSLSQRSGVLMKEDELLRFLENADGALTYLHSRHPPVIHRDLKPSNVIRRADGSYAFVDFGAVRDRLRPEGGSTVVGTFGYMAPEQFQGRAGPASDVYAIGCTAIALLTGEEPEKLPHRGLALDVDAAIEGRAPWVKDVLRDMLEPDPDKRARSIGPLLARAKGSERRRSDVRREPGREPFDAVANAINAAAFGSRHDRHVARHAARRAAKEAQRAVKDAQRNARRELRRVAHRHDHGELPLFVRILFTMGLAIAQVAVALSLHVVVPVLLTFLSVFFGSGLRRAASSVREAGDRAGRAITEAQERLAQREYPPEGVRVAAKEVDAAPTGVRVRAPEKRAAPEKPGPMEEEEEEELVEDEEGRRRQVR